MARLCTMLGIFPEDAQVPLDVVAMLWVAAGRLEDAAEAEDCVDRMVALQLVELREPQEGNDNEEGSASEKAEQRFVSMIDLHGDYLRCRGKSDAARWHARDARGDAAALITHTVASAFAQAARFLAAWRERRGGRWDGSRGLEAPERRDSGGKGQGGLQEELDERRREAPHAPRQADASEQPVPPRGSERHASDVPGTSRQTKAVLTSTSGTPCWSTSRRPRTSCPKRHWQSSKTTTRRTSL